MAVTRICPTRHAVMCYEQAHHRSFRDTCTGFLIGLAAWERLLDELDPSSLVSGKTICVRLEDPSLASAQVGRSSFLVIQQLGTAHLYRTHGHRLRVEHWFDGDAVLLLLYQMTRSRVWRRMFCSTALAVIPCRYEISRR